MKTTRPIFILFLFFFASASVQAQQVKIKDGKATVDKIEMCGLKDDAVRRLSFSLYTLDEEEQLYFKWIDYGQFGYFEVYDAEDLDDVLFESDVITGYRKWIVKQLYAANVLSVDGIDDEQLEIFAKKMGKEHSRIREENSSR